jgi:hypothetical protein
VAQLVARLVRNEKARGSNPLSSTNVDGGPVGAAINIYRDMGFEEEHPQGVTDPLSGPPTTAVSMAYMPLSFLACPIRHLV